MTTESRYAHRMMRGGREVTIYNDSTFEEMGEIYGEEYLGEVCSTSGMMRRVYIAPRVEELLREAAFEFSQGPRGDTAFEIWRNLQGNDTDRTYSTFLKHLSFKGEPVHDPMHEQVFGESNLANQTSSVKITEVSLAGIDTQWQQLYLSDCREFGIDIANERLSQRSMERAERLPDHQRNELERLLETTEIMHPDQCGLVMPTREDYSAACKGNAPWPVMPQFMGNIKQLVDSLPEIKGVTLRNSNIPSHLKEIIDGLLNRPAMNPDDIFGFLEEVNRQEAMRFLITSRSEEVIKALRKWIKRMRNRAETEALNRRSAEKQLALFKANVEHLERQSYIVLEEVFNYQGFRREFIIDNVEDTTFNVSVKTQNGGVPIMTVKYDDYGFTVKAHR